MPELTAESTFREWYAECYNKKQIKSKGIKAYFAKVSLIEEQLLPLIGDMTLENLKYSYCISILGSIKSKGYSDDSIRLLWSAVRKVFKTATVLGVVEMPDLIKFPISQVLDEAKNVAGTISGKEVPKYVFPDSSIISEFVITKRTPLFSYCIYLYKENENRGHHKASWKTIELINRYVDKHILSKPISDINKYDIKRICYDISHSGLSEGCYIPILIFIRYGFTEAYNKGLIDSSLYDSFYVPEHSRITKFYYSDEEYKLIREAIKKSDLKNLYILTESLGLRKCEVISLETKSYNKEQGMLTIEKTIVDKHWNNYEFYTSNDFKKVKKRSIKLPDIAVEALDNELEKRERKKMMAGDKWNNAQDYIFTNQYGDFVDSGYLFKDELKVKLMSGVNSFSLCNLRRSTIYRLQMIGVSFDDIQNYMGTNYHYYYLNKSYNTKNNSDWRDEDI